MIRKSKGRFVSGTLLRKQYASLNPPSDAEAVKRWLRKYSDELARVGIQLRLTRAEKTALESRLLVIYQDLRARSSIDATFAAEVPVCRPKDPITIRWFDDHVSVQADS